MNLFKFRSLNFYGFTQKNNVQYHEPSVVKTTGAGEHGDGTCTPYWGKSLPITALERDVHSRFRTFNMLGRAAQHI